jgi:hypothetical protein
MNTFFGNIEGAYHTEVSPQMKGKKERANLLENQGLTKKPQNMVDKLPERYYI